MSQTSYSESMPIGQAGDLAIACDDDNLVCSYIPFTADVIEPGLCVVQKAANEGFCELPAASSDKIVGVALRDPVLEDDPLQTTMTFPDGWKTAVVSRGSVWVQLEEAVTPDDDVYVRFTGEPEVFTIDFDVNFVTSNVINGTVGGVAISPVTFNTDQATTIQALADAIELLTSSVASATVTATKQITVTGLVNAVRLSSTTNFTVTLGAGQAVDTVANVSGPSAGDQSGIFRTDDDDTGNGATAVQISQARFLTSGSAGNVALLDLNLP